MTAVCTSVRVCPVMIHYIHCCTELKFTVQQLLLNVLCFNLQLQGYNCGNYYYQYYIHLMAFLQDITGKPAPER